MKQPAHAVKGIIGAGEPPLEARVSRLDECRLKQKVGYGQDVDPYILLKGEVPFHIFHSFDGGLEYWTALHSGAVAFLCFELFESRL